MTKVVSCLIIFGVLWTLVISSALAVNLAIGLDYSGSDQEAFKEAQRVLPGFLRENLQPGDTVSLIAFGDQATIVFSRVITKQNLPILTEKITSLVVESDKVGTEVMDGWRLTGQCLNQFNDPNGQNIILFISDGQPDYQKLRPDLPEITPKKVWLIGYNNLEREPNLLQLLEVQGKPLELCGCYDLGSTLAGPIAESLGRVESSEPTNTSSNLLVGVAKTSLEKPNRHKWWLWPVGGLAVVGLATVIWRQRHNIQPWIPGKELPTLEIAQAVTKEESENGLEPIFFPYQLKKGQELAVGEVDLAKGHYLPRVHGSIRLGLTEDKIIINPGNCDRVEIFVNQKTSGDGNGHQVVSRLVEKPLTIEADAVCLRLSEDRELLVRRV